jgi:hypothetical protein
MAAVMLLVVAVLVRLLPVVGALALAAVILPVAGLPTVVTVVIVPEAPSAGRMMKTVAVVTARLTGIGAAPLFLLTETIVIFARVCGVIPAHNVLSINRSSRVPSSPPRG